ncbi:MAG TPA: hypothetical protein VNM69_01895 [Bacillus sp. (in: firmicutes)]|nr:hypothetical protein [Bacillus sp. (in: firmicutes)]
MAKEEEKNEVLLMDFLKRLKREVELHQEFGTSWTKEISSLAFFIANETRCISLFMDKEITKKAVIDLLPNLSKEKAEDVAKKLYKTAKWLYLNATLPNEIKDYLTQKRQERRPLTFVKQSNDSKRRKNNDR